MEAKVPISVVILAKNEAGRIRACIESVLWATEVLVIDDESTDDTASIAESLGARVVRRKMDIEGKHRNWAHAQAANEWILSVDADERVTPELAEEIKALFQAQPPCELYSFPRRNYIGSHWIRYGGWYPSVQVKLFKRSIFRWEETTVHPRAFSNSPEGVLKSDLIHYTYRDLKDFVDKLNRQTTLEAQKWILDGRHVSLGKMLWRSLDRFGRAYRGKQGYRDGELGFILAVMGGMYQFISFAKYWERQYLSDDGLRAAVKHEKNGRIPMLQTNALTPLSCVVITKNEAKRVETLLDSLPDGAEIIVIDDLSSDGTAELCRSYGAKVLVHSSGGDFDQQRNRGIDAATRSWVLQLDADEVLPESLAREIKEKIDNPGAASAFRISRRNYFLGKEMRYGGWHGQQMVKLFRKDKGRYVGHSVHETIEITGPIDSFREAVNHYPFESIGQFVARQNFYSTIEAGVMRQKLGALTEKRLHNQLRRSMRRTFFKIFIKKWGWRDGMHGFIFAVLYGWVDFLKWAKYWEGLYLQPAANGEQQ